MAASLDMSLDDIIRKNKRSEGYNGNSNNNFIGGRGSSRGRGGGRPFGPGPARRLPTTRPPIRPTPYSGPQDAMQTFQAPNANSSMGGGWSSMTGTNTKLYISNLEYSVSNDDLKLLFSDVGELKHYSLHYDRSGRSKGTAEVVFTSQEHALAAIKRYNNVQLDGKPMKIEVVGINVVSSPLVIAPTANGILGNPPSNFRSMQDGIGNLEMVHGGGRGYGGWVRGGDGGGRGYGRGPGQGRGWRNHPAGSERTSERKVSAEDLDADLDKYHSEAMNIN